VKKLARCCAMLALASFANSGTVFAAQRLGGGTSPEVSLVRVFLALLVCLIVASLAILLVRQRLRGGRLPIFTRLASTSGRIRLLESRRIAPQTDLCLVEVDGAEHLLLIAPGGTLPLDHRPTASLEPANR